MSMTRKKICPACKQVCAERDPYCQGCHTSLHNAPSVMIPSSVIVHDPALHGERFVVIPPVTAHADEEYLNLFKRPVLYRSMPAHLDIPRHKRLADRAVRFQFMGLGALMVACVTFGWSFVMTVCVYLGWQVVWIPFAAWQDVLVPLGYAITILQLGAAYSAFCARDYALNLVDIYQKIPAPQP